MSSKTPQLPVIPVKVVVLGPAYAGKTSLVIRLVKETYQNEQTATVGAMFLNKFFTFDKYVIKYELWDTAGEEKYSSLAPLYFRGAKIAIIVFDISSLESFNRAKLWTREFKLHSTEQTTIMVLIANKCDLERAVSKADCEKYAQDEGMTYYEASAKDNTNVNTIFQTLAERVPPPTFENNGTNNNGKRDSIVNVNGNGKPKKKCC